MYNRYIALQQYPVPVTTLTQPSRAIISKDDEVELIEIDLSAASELSKLRISSERDQLDKIILDLKKYDTACRYGQACIEGDQIKGVRIKFNHPNKYSYILIKDFISALNKKKMYNDTNIVCIKNTKEGKEIEINEDGEEFKITRDSIYEEENKITESTLKMKNIEQVPLLIHGSIDFQQEFIRNVISSNFLSRCEQVKISGDSEVLAAYKIENKIVIEFSVISSSLAVTNAKEKDNQDGTLLVTMYYIEKQISKDVSKCVNKAIEDLISNHLILNLSKKKFDRKELKRKIVNINREKNGEIYIQSEIDSLKIYFYKDKREARNIFKELEDFCGVEVITKLKTFKFTEIEKNLYKKIVKDFEDIISKIESNFDDLLTISMNTSDDSELSMELKFVGPEEQVKEGEELFEERLNKIKRRLEKEDRVEREHDTVDIDEFNRKKKKYHKEMERFEKQAKENKVKFPKTWTYENMQKEGNIKFWSAPLNLNKLLVLTFVFVKFFISYL